MMPPYRGDKWLEVFDCQEGNRLRPLSLGTCQRANAQGGQMPRRSVIGGSWSATKFRAMGGAVVGLITMPHSHADLENPENRRFVAEARPPLRHPSRSLPPRPRGYGRRPLRRRAAGARADRPRGPADAGIICDQPSVRVWPNTSRWRGPRTGPPRDRLARLPEAETGRGARETPQVLAKVFAAMHRGGEQYVRQLTGRLELPPPHGSRWEGMRARRKLVRAVGTAADQGTGGDGWVAARPSWVRTNA
jgi:hypothetical protein